MIWKLPLNKIARKYDISRLGIKNACKKMEISLPGSKYWTKYDYVRKATPKLSEYQDGKTSIEIFKKQYEMQSRNAHKTTPLV